MFFFDVLGLAVNHLDYHSTLLSPADHLFLTLMKLRQAKDDVELSMLFNISERTVSCILTTWINFLYFQLKDINIWPSKDTIQQHMPKHFGKLFNNTRVILDATECPIDKPSNISSQSKSFSTYKNRNTYKVMVGCTPRGAVSFISDAYGGCTSDRQIIERSALCTDPNKFDKGDSIMADRGIMVQDLFATKDVFVNTTYYNYYIIITQHPKCFR